MKRLLVLIAFGGISAIICANLLAREYVVSQATDAALRTAFKGAWYGDTITFDPSLFSKSSSVTIKLATTIVIDGAVSVIGPESDKGVLILDGDSQCQIFYTLYDISLKNLVLQNGFSKGGDGKIGGPGGGGGAGMGGAIFVEANTLTCENVSFYQNSAVGGHGGGTNNNLSTGGWGGDSCWLGRNNNHGGVGGDCSPGGTGFFGSGGGGGAGEWWVHTDAKNGGDGGFGGGGGGGGGGLFTCNQGGASLHFGGDGAAGEWGWNHGGGGGGAGLGGAIFVKENAHLKLQNCTFAKNTAYGGKSGVRAEKGQGKGGAIFVMDKGSVIGNEVSFSNNAASDDSADSELPLYDDEDVYGDQVNLDSYSTAFPPVEETPTPTLTPTLTPTAMPTSVSKPIYYTFPSGGAEEKQITVQGAGFGTYPQAEVTYGEIPTDNAFASATDGQGLIVTSRPGEGVMIYAAKVENNLAAMIQCSIRTEGGDASVIVASIGDLPNQFISYNTTNNGQYFNGQYRRLATFCTPPTSGFTPVVQILNTSADKTVTAYIDNLIVLPIDVSTYYHGELLNGDEVDPNTLFYAIPEDRIATESSEDGN